MLCDQEGNHRFGIAFALAMRNRLCGLSTYGLTATDREMSTPPTLHTFIYFTMLGMQQRGVKNKQNTYLMLS